MDSAVDGDGGFSFKVLAEAGVEPVHFLDDTPLVFAFREPARLSRVGGGEEL